MYYRDRYFMVEYRVTKSNRYLMLSRNEMKARSMTVPKINQFFATT